MKKETLLFLQSTALFQGVDLNDLSSMLGCLQTQVLTYAKGEAIFRQGDDLSQIALVLDGNCTSKPMITGAIIPSSMT